MDIYQCMHCGDRWAHGGMRDAFVRAATHADETRGNPEGMHLVLVGDMDRLEAQYENIKAGVERLPAANDNIDPRPRPEPPEMPPAKLRLLAHQLGAANIEEAQAFVKKMRELFEEPLPARPATEDVFPEGGKVDVW